MVASGFSPFILGRCGACCCYEVVSHALVEARRVGPFPKRNTYEIAREAIAKLLEASLVGSHCGPHSGRNRMVAGVLSGRDWLRPPGEHGANGNSTVCHQGTGGECLVRGHGVLRRYELLAAAYRMAHKM